MPWLWRKRPAGRAERVYVPIISQDGRPWEEKWADEQYLRTVKAFRGNQVFLDLAAYALGQLREAADAAKTPDELAGMNRGLAWLKWLLCVPARAESELAMLEYARKAKKEQDADSLG